MFPGPDYLPVEKQLDLMKNCCQHKENRVFITPVKLIPRQVDELKNAAVDYEIITME